MTSFVYFLGDPSSDSHIKIGFSRYPDRRLRSIKLQAGNNYQLLAVAPGGFADEQKLHNIFQKYSVGGEWFRKTNDIMSLISEVTRSGELPQSVRCNREQVILNMRKAGRSINDIAEEFRLTGQAVRQILKNASWEDRKDATITRIIHLYGLGANDKECANGIGETIVKMKERYFSDSKVVSARLRRYTKGGTVLPNPAGL